ncbi:MAG: TatD family hydrolase [Candidatus Spechtbacteria bacterium]|nr:TatD family hydrolase [Candidatus Spechtbacteria bacterium]
MSPILIDTHGHVQFNAFREDGHEVVKRALAAGTWIVAPGSQIDTSKRAIKYAEAYDEGVYAAVGLHPIHLEETRVDEAEVGTQPTFPTRHELFARENYEPLFASKKVVAIGEVGLDYWRRPKTTGRRIAYMNLQKETLIAQLDLAADHNLPVIIHCRVAFNDTIEILKNHRITNAINPPGIIHSYTGNEEQLNTFMEMGYYIGLNGIIFKLPLDEVIKKAPLERIVLETDSPYLAPPQSWTKEGLAPPKSRMGGTKEGLTSPQLGDARNEPINVKYVAERVAELKGISFDEVASQTTRNARAIFRI